MGSGERDDHGPLLRRIREGDPAAETEFVSLFRERIRFLVRSRLRNREYARDIVQEVLLNVLLALRNGNLREHAKLEGYIWSTAIHTLNSHRRLERPDPVQPATAVEISQPAEAEEGVAAGERMRLIHEALLRLTEMERQVIRLTLLDGLTPAGIAQRLNLKVEAIRKRKSRALAKIQRHVRRRFPSF